MRKHVQALFIAFFFFAGAMHSHAQWNLTGNATATATSILGTTNAIPLNLTTNNIKRMVIDASGKVGIGTSSPVNILTVNGSGSTPAASWVNAGAPLFVGYGETTPGNSDYVLTMASANVNARPVFVGRRSRGILSTPAVVVNNDLLMSMLSSGYDGATFQNAATVDYYVDGTPTSGNVPTRISFVTGSNSGNRTERLKIGSTGNIAVNGTQLTITKSNGRVGIGEATPQGALHVSQPGIFTGVTFTGTGLNDLSTNISGYTGTGATYYAIRIQNAGPAPNMIEISSDSGATWAAAIPIANPVTLPYGVTATFGSTSGHAFGNRWNWTVNQGFYNTLVVKDGNTGVGTASPNARLDVKGDALINGINAGIGGGSFTSNTAFGVGTLTRNTTGTYGTGSGYNALAYNTTGIYNTAVGGFSQVNVTKANYNTSVGMYSLYYDSTTGSNTAIGLSAGDYSYNPTQGTFLGSSSYAGANLTNMTAVGYNTVVSASNAVRVGNFYVTSIGGQVGWTTFSDGRFKKNVQEDVPGLTFINKLRPVTYNLNVNDIENKLQEIVTVKPRNQGDNAPVGPPPFSTDTKARDEKAKIKYTGFLAQEVEAAAKSLNYDFSGVDAPKNDKDFYGLRYDEFVIPLVKAVQELSKDNEQLKMNNEQLKSKDADLQKQIDDLKAMLHQFMNTKATAPCPPIAGK